MNKFKKLAVVLLAITMTAGFTACGSSSAPSYKGDSAGNFISTSEESAYDYSYGYEDGSLEYPAEALPEGEMPQEAEKLNDSARKLIKTYDLNVETEEFDGFLDMIQSKVVSLGGYIENLNTYTGSNYYNYNSSRYSNLTIRIPVARADEFINLVGEKGNITNNSLSVEDITLTYVDLASRKATYEAEEKRILELLSKAETIEEILVIEDKLANIRYQLESMESQLRTFDNLVDYTTIHLNIEEVKQYTEPAPDTYGQRISKSFSRGLKNVKNGFVDFSVGFVGALPGLVVFAAFCAIVVFAVKAIVKASKKKKAAKAAAQYNAYQQQLQMTQEKQNAQDNKEE